MAGAPSPSAASALCLLRSGSGPTEPRQPTAACLAGGGTVKRRLKSGAPAPTSRSSDSSDLETAVPNGRCCSCCGCSWLLMAGNVKRGEGACARGLRHCVTPCARVAARTHAPRCNRRPPAARCPSRTRRPAPQGTPPRPQSRSACRTCAPNRSASDRFRKGSSQDKNSVAVGTKRWPWSAQL